MDLSKLKEFELTIRIKNNRLVKLRESHGLTVSDFCKAVRIHPTTYYGFVSMTRRPHNKNGEWKQAALRLADFANALPEDLFPEAVRAIQKTHAKLELAAAEVLALASVESSAHLIAPDVAVENYELRKIVDDMLATLEPREAEILRLRFGFDESECHTLRETGQKIDNLAFKSADVSASRVRQIEAKALRKLRHSSRAKYLKAAMYGEEIAESCCVCARLSDFYELGIVLCNQHVSWVPTGELNILQNLLSDGADRAFELKVAEIIDRLQTRARNCI